MALTSPPEFQCLVVEDSPAGIAAARAAGMSVVAVPDPNMDAALFAAADVVLPSLHEFRPELWGLPPLETAASSARPDLEAASAS